jgi:hypothetical protein
MSWLTSFLNSPAKHYLWWPVCVVLYYFAYSWLSKINNESTIICDEQGIPWWKSRDLWVMYVFGALCPFWVIVSRISKNLLFDGMLYDNILFLTYAFTLLFLGAGSCFTMINWVGLGFVILGSIMLRIT